MSATARAKRRSDVKETGKNVNISHSPINITNITVIVNNIVENSPNLDETIDRCCDRIVEELQQLAQYDLQALEALNKIMSLVEELRKTDSRERKLTIFEKILSMASSVLDISKLLTDLLRR